MTVRVRFSSGHNRTVTVPGLGGIVFDKQVTDKDGNLTVEAADITLAGGREVVLGYAMCGGAMPAGGRTMKQGQ